MIAALLKELGLEAEALGGSTGLEHFGSGESISSFSPVDGKTIGQVSTVLILAIITFGALKPLLNRILVPSAGVGGAGGGMSEADLEPEEAESEVEVQEGESIEDIKAKLKPKKTAISAEMLDTANTYDDKVAVIRMIVGDEAGKVSNVFRQLMKKDA